MVSLALTDRINVMKAERLKIIEALKGGEPASTLNGLLSHTYERSFAPTEMNVSIVFIDIVGFSQVAERTDSYHVFRLLENLMREIGDIVSLHGGAIDRSLGDGLLCLFGYEASQTKDHTESAFTAARRIQERIMEIILQGPEGQQKFITPLRIGLHVDDVLIGNLGGGHRIDFTMVGNGVNFASRLETACSPFKIMVSAAARKALPKTLREDPGFSPILVAVKHQVELIKAHEFNPFYGDAPRLKLAEMSFLSQLSHNPEEPRFAIVDQTALVLESAVGKFAVHDFSDGGFRTFSDTYVGQKVSLLVHVRTFDQATNDFLRDKMLHNFYVEIRWSRATTRGYEHGIKIAGLNPEQRWQIFTRLSAIFDSDGHTRVVLAARPLAS